MTIAFMLCLVRLLLLAVLILVNRLVFRTMRMTASRHGVCQKQPLPWRKYESRHEQETQQVLVSGWLHIA
jgi:hypothetical protein